MPYTNYLSDESTLSPRHRELLILRVAWLCANPSIWATHAARARSAGFTAAEIRRIAQGPDASGWDPFEATLLRLADQLFRNSAVNEATWRALSANYDMFHQIDAVETAGHFIMLAMMYNSDTSLLMTAITTVSDFRAISVSLNAYGVQLEEGDEHFPKLPAK